MPRLLAFALAAFLAACVGAKAQDAKLRFVMVTHGGSGSAFWGLVREGADLAAQEAGVEVVYRAPDSFDLEKMAGLVTDAVEDKPDGLIVSIPNADALAGPIRAAVDAGIPVISINSGFDVGQSLGALLHVGQGEYEAGRVAGQAMRELAGTKALCLNHELGNVALDLRCKGFIDGFAGSVEVVPVPADEKEAGEAIGKRLEDDEKIDVILALSASDAGEPAIDAAKALEGRKVHVATFDVTDAVLRAVAAGDASFAIDQQPFLQGFLPVQFLALLHRQGDIPVSNISTGPRLITQAEAKRRLPPSEAEGAESGQEPADEGDGAAAEEAAPVSDG